MARWSYESVEDRFWRKVDPTSEPLGCWLWIASLNQAGYGQFRIVLDDGRATMRRAHRIAYEFMVAPIPNGLHLDHLCRVRACVNPWHLDPVTNRVNAQRGEHRGTRPLKTHCPSMHAYTPENTRIDNEGYRRCRQCERRDWRNGNLRRRGIAA